MSENLATTSCCASRRLASKNLITVKAFLTRCLNEHQIRMFKSAAIGTAWSKYNYPFDAQASKLLHCKTLQARLAGPPSGMPVQKLNGWDPPAIGTPLRPP